MKSILDELYYGDLAPFESLRPGIAQFYEKREQAFAGHDAFLPKLTQEQAREFESLLDKHLDVIAPQMKESFLEGFRLGVRLMAEAFA